VRFIETSERGMNVIRAIFLQLTPTKIIIIALLKQGNLRVAARRRLAARGRERPLHRRRRLKALF
jgi:hypothetical protein